VQPFFKTVILRSSYQTGVFLVRGLVMILFSWKNNSLSHQLHPGRQDGSTQCAFTTITNLKLATHLSKKSKKIVSSVFIYLPTRNIHHKHQVGGK